MDQPFLPLNSFYNGSGIWMWELYRVKQDKMNLLGIPMRRAMFSRD